MIDRLRRRLSNLVAFGQTTAAMDDAGATPKVQARLSDLETHPGLQVIGHFGFSSSMPPGTNVVALFADGDRSKGVMLGTVDPATRRAGLKPGEVSVGPSITIEIHFAADQVTIKHPTKVRVESPMLECTGEVKAMCDGAFVTLSEHKGHTGGGQPPTPNT